VYTHRLINHPFRRIVETAQFVLDVMAPDGLGHSGRGVRSAQKVRLMHAAIRHLILAAEGMDVRRIKTDDGCYEVKAIDARGRRIEAYYDPRTLELVKYEREEDDD
jgi:hypothetical protein